MPDAENNEGSEMLPEPIRSWIVAKARSLTPRKATSARDKETVEEVRLKQEAKLNRLTADYVERMNKVRSRCQGASEEEIILIVANSLGKPRGSLADCITDWVERNKDLQLSEVRMQLSAKNEQVKERDKMYKGMEQQMTAVVDGMNSVCLMVNKVMEKIDNFSLPASPNRALLDEPKKEIH